MSKQIKIILSIVAIIIVAGLAYAFWPNSTADNGQNVNINNKHVNSNQKAIGSMDLPSFKKGWKLYQNNQSGFSIEIPEGWTILEVPQFNRIQFYSDGVLRDDQDEYAYMGKSDVIIFYNLKEQNNYIKNSKEQINFNVNGYPAIKYIDVSGGQDPDFSTLRYNIIVIKTDKNIYQINFLTQEYSDNKFVTNLSERIFDEMLSSLKFIK